MTTPFVLSIARPDYKRPSVELIFGSNISIIHIKLYNFFYDYLYHENICTYDEYIDNYYSYSYMDNKPFELKIFDINQSIWKDKKDIIIDIFNEAINDVIIDKKDQDKAEEEDKDYIVR